MKTETFLKKYLWWIVAVVAMVVIVSVVAVLVSRSEGEQTTAGPTMTLTPMFSVADYGATSNDSNNDEAAILKTIAAAKGAIVYFPPGNYAVSEGFMIPADATVRGDSAGQSYLMVTEALPDGTFTWKFTWIKP